MKKFLNNSFVDVSVKGDMHIIDMFSLGSGKKTLSVGENSHLTYLIVAKSTHLDVCVEMVGAHSSCQLFALVVSEKEPMNMKLITHIAHSSVQVEKRIVSLLGEGGKISVDAHIDIHEGIKQVVAHLLEENIIFGQHISVASLPSLSVASHDVQASHGAKIEKINQEKLFYMQAKGLSYHRAQTLVVDGYVNEILSHFDMFSDKELSSIKDFVQL